ncbi:MAG: DUF4384 domain-containing protein [Desulfobulbaceae bacterium]|nr:DUF4384 domain-containing protein [Desulfobulbaceae bacterium]
MIISLILLQVSSGALFGGERWSFSWAFLHKSRDGQVSSLDFEAEQPVSEGELLRLYLELHDGAFVYLYLFDSQADLYLVFPPSAGFYSGEIPTGYQSYIPPGRKWFTLDGLKGTERFYLLASGERLIELERLTETFLGDGNRELQARLLAKLAETADRLSGAASYEVDRIPIPAVAAGTGADSAEYVNAHKISAIGGYGRVLDLVNK